MSEDACTAWPDGWPAWLGGSGDEWRHCCIQHDAAYEAGTSTIQSHIDLAACVGQESWTMATVMFLGLMTLGWGYIIHIRNRLTKGARKD